MLACFHLQLDSLFSAGGDPTKAFDIFAFGTTSAHLTLRPVRCSYDSFNTCHRSRPISTTGPRNSVTEGAPTHPCNGTTEQKEHPPEPLEAARPPPRHQHREEGKGAAPACASSSDAQPVPREGGDTEARQSKARRERAATPDLLLKHPDATLATYV